MVDLVYSLISSKFTVNKNIYIKSDVLAGIKCSKSTCVCSGGRGGSDTSISLDYSGGVSELVS